MMPVVGRSRGRSWVPETLCQTQKLARLQSMLQLPLQAAKGGEVQFKAEKGWCRSMLGSGRHPLKRRS